MVQQTVQVILTTIWTLFAGPIAEAITPRWWYGLGAVLAGVQFLVTLFFIPETKYDRSMAAFQEAPSDGSVDVTLCTERPPLDFVNYPARTWRSDMRLWVGTPDWSKAVDTLFVSSPSPPPASLGFRDGVAYHDGGAGAENVPSAPLPQRVLGAVPQRADARDQHRHWHDVQQHHHGGAV